MDFMHKNRIDACCAFPQPRPVGRHIAGFGHAFLERLQPCGAEWGGMPRRTLLRALDKPARGFAKELMEKEPLDAYGWDDGSTVLTNNAATAPVTNAAMAGHVIAGYFYNAYGGRNNIAGRAGAKMDGRTGMYTEMVNYFRKKIEEFVGIDTEKDALIYAMNTSDALGKLALACKFTKEDVVLVPQMEHTSNSLPWEKSGATVVRIKQLEDGAIDIGDMKAKLGQYDGSVKMVAFTAASNITGIRPPTKELVGLAHGHGALVAVDCAQYAPHFPMDKKEWGADFVAFSAHKLGGPAGLGVLAAPLWWLREHEPVIPGGGTITDLKREGGTLRITWAPNEAKHQPGTWNTTGIVALGAVAEALGERWAMVMEQEKELLEYAYRKFTGIPGFTPLPVEPGRYEKEQLTPVISFNLEGYRPDEVSIRLSEAGIQNRGGEDDPICNHEYVRDVLALRGIVRLSFSFHNKKEEIDRIADVLLQMRKERPL